METSSVLIVGAGLSGLSAAMRLAGVGPNALAPEGTQPTAAGDAEAGRPTVRIVESGKSVGGRLATRQMGHAVLDHGAQFFTVRSAAMQAQVEAWLAEGVVEEWCRGFAEVDGYPRYRAVGGMQALARHLRSQLDAAGVAFVTGRRVQALVPAGDAWSAIYDGATREPDEAGAVVLTPPVPDALPLLQAGGVPLRPEHRELLGGFGYHRVLALLTVLDRSPGLADPGALQQPDDPTFSFVADNQAKGISPQPAVTFHTAHALSAELWDLSDAEVTERLLGPARALLGDATIVEHQLKRWRHSGPRSPHPDPCLVVADTPGPLALAGDGFGGSKFEGAYLSGLAAATAVAGQG